jgi:hypothetical protein
MAPQAILPGPVFADPALFSAGVTVEDLAHACASFLGNESELRVLKPESFGSGRTFTDMTACPSLDTPMSSSAARRPTRGFGCQRGRSRLDFVAAFLVRLKITPCGPGIRGMSVYLIAHLDPR